MTGQPVYGEGLNRRPISKTGVLALTDEALAPGQ